MEKVELKLVSVDRLAHAPWNPRDKEELALDNPAMVELIASVKSMGLTQSLAVWGCETDRDSEPMLVIAGNRRMEAAKAAGLSKVPALVYTGIDDTRAREITRAENEIRSNINPLRDAQLIDEMIAAGLSQKEIAAHFAMSEAMVCRRRKLCGLIDEVRAIAERSRNISTDALERIALYPADTQRECVQTISRRAKDKDALVKWKDIQWDFDRTVHSLDGATFDTADCNACAYRTGAQADLWGDLPKHGGLGSCLKLACFNRKVREALAVRARAEIGPNVDLVDGEEAGVYYYDLNNSPLFGDRRSKSRPVAWWFFESYSNKFKVYWGPSLLDWKAAQEEAERKRAAYEAASKEESEQRDAEAKAAREAREKLAAERSRLSQAATDCADTACSPLRELSDAEVAKRIAASAIGRAFKSKQRDMLVKIVNDWIDSLSYNDEDLMRLFVAFPDLALQLDVPPHAISDWQKARAALERFDKAHANS